MVETVGIIRYRDKTCIAELSKDFDRYYRTLIPQTIEYAFQKYQAHITIIRNFENSINELWRNYSNLRLIIEYEPTLYYDSDYYFMKCWCPKIGEIRMNSGLSEFRKDGCYHITLGNTKS